MERDLEEEFFRMSISMSLDKKENLIKIIEFVKDEEEGDSLFVILDESTSRKGADGLRVVLEIFSSLKIYLHYAFIEEMINNISNGYYDPIEEITEEDMEETEEMIDLYRSYLYIDEEK